MKSKMYVLLAILMLFPLIAFAQPQSVKEFHQAEWQMKLAHWQELQKRNVGNLVLDQTDYDAKYWQVEIDVTDINGETISGKVTMTSASTIDGLNQIDYDLHSSMIVDSVFMSGEPVTYSHPGHTLTITLDHAYDTGDLFTTVVYYHGQPAGGGFGSFTWDTHQGQPIISTLSEPEGAREWWPCKDQPHDKADSADVLITTPDNLVGTSNGVMVSNIDNGDGTRTFHWHVSYPITTYLICLSVSNYQAIYDWYVTADGDSMPVTHYVYPEHYNDAVEDLSITPDAIGFYASLFGEYPFLREKYGHSIFPWGGAMEHQCNTSYGSGLIRGNHQYDFILVHELSHQWFGDMITCDIWPEIWMNEGFASYCEALWAEHIYGEDYYHSYMESSNGVSDPSGPIYDPDPLFGGNTVYNKGSWVLHMLRGVMGDDAFFEGMYDYANDPRYMYGTITTREFQAVMEDHYGGDLGWYFDEWVWGMNRPYYRYSWIDEPIGNNQYEVFLHIRQTQPSPAPNVFTMPIKVYPRIGGADTLITVFNDSRIDDIRFVVNGDPTQLQFDKDDWILKFASNEAYGMNIVTTELPAATQNIEYSATVESRGGQVPYSYAVQSGDLPPGLTLDGDTGEISGVPTTVDDYEFTIRCTDSANPPNTDDQDYVLVVNSQVSVPDNKPLPEHFALVGNYPNPFNNSTLIKFQLAKPAVVHLSIYNILGQEVTTLQNGAMSAGEHAILWQADSVPSGIYFYKLTAGEHSAVKKLTLLK